MTSTRPQYGRTWWGAQWLEALSHIDFDNRLPRGRTYANRGAVRDLVIDGGRIQARVQGSRPQPYKVEVIVPPVPPADAERLIERLAADPALIARLLNRELDPAVLGEAQSLKIAVFPSRWSDLTMQCSCPDWAVPCKHLAAVIYLLSQEIDGNPFLVFSLRNLDLPALLRQRGLRVDDHAATDLPSMAQVLFDGGDDSVKAAAAEGKVIVDLAVLDRLDFTTIPDLREPLWRVLAPKPVFFHGDFREVARVSAAGIAKVANQAMEAEAVDAMPAATGEALVLSVDDHGTLSVAGPADSLRDLLTLVSQLPASRLDDVPANLVAIRHLHLFALHLLARGAVVPQVVSLPDKMVGVRWFPAELDATVSAMLGEVALALPAGLVRHRVGRKTTPLQGRTQARLLVSALVDVSLRAAGEPARPAGTGGKVVDLFYGAGRARFDGPGEGAVAGSIHAWLARLHVTRSRHVPLLQIDEDGEGGGFTLAVAVQDDAGTLAAPVPLAKVLSAAAWAERRLPILQTVAMLGEFHPPLNGYVRGGAKRPLPMPSADLPAFLFDTLPALRLLGIRALLPKALDRLLRPRLSMQLKAKSGSEQSFLRADQLFTFDWKVSLGDQELTPAEFERLLGQATGIVRFRGEYVYLDPAAVERLRAQLARPQKVAPDDLLRIALAGEYDGAAITLNKAAQKLLEHLKDAADVPLPKGLRATLRPYQERGFAWLYRNARLGLGGVIADDMGLGKTLQVLALLLRLKEEGGFDAGGALVIVPTSLLTNWQKEAARFTPTLQVDVFHGSKRELAKVRPDVLLTTYGVARTEAALLKAMTWRVVIVDEAQNIKNPAAAQTRAVKTIPAGTCFAMTGTPVENRLSEYWSIMDFAQRGYLGGPTQFAREYATPIQTHRDAAAAERLRRVMAPFMLRRLKSDKSIIDDLPDKLEQDQYCLLSKTQVALYESVVQEGLKSIAGESETFKRQGLVLQMILALKQVCNHPAQYLKQGADEPMASGKVERLFDLLDEIHAAQEKVLVFTQFREMGELLQRWLRERDGGREPLFLHGGVPRARRDKMVDAFQNERTERVFLLSLKAGGTGLNLTAASHVIHFDLWWNPAVEAQATDRAYRIGQQRNVQVHRFITRGTFEERINEMIRSKRELAELTVGTGETWIGQLPPKELRALFELR